MKSGRAFKHRFVHEQVYTPLQISESYSVTGAYSVAEDEALTANRLPLEFGMYWQGSQRKR